MWNNFWLIKNNFCRIKNIGSLQKSIFEREKLVYNLPNVLKIGDYVSEQLKQLPKKYLEIEKTYKYPVEISEKLQKLVEKTKKEILAK